MAITKETKKLNVLAFIWICLFCSMSSLKATSWEEQKENNVDEHREPNAPISLNQAIVAVQSWQKDLKTKKSMKEPTVGSLEQDLKKAQAAVMSIRQAKVEDSLIFSISPPSSGQSTLLAYMLGNTFEEDEETCHAKLVEPNSKYVFKTNEKGTLQKTTDMKIYGSYCDAVSLQKEENAYWMHYTTHMMLLNAQQTSKIIIPLELSALKSISGYYFRYLASVVGSYFKPEADAEVKKSVFLIITKTEDIDKNKIKQQIFNAMRNAFQFLYDDYLKTKYNEAHRLFYENTMDEQFRTLRRLESAKRFMDYFLKKGFTITGQDIEEIEKNVIVVNDIVESQRAKLVFDETKILIADIFDKGKTRQIIQNALQKAPGITKSQLTPLSSNVFFQFIQGYISQLVQDMRENAEGYRDLLSQPNLIDRVHSLEENIQAAETDIQSLETDTHLVLVKEMTYSRKFQLQYFSINASVLGIPFATAAWAVFRHYSNISSQLTRKTLAAMLMGSAVVLGAMGNIVLQYWNSAMVKPDFYDAEDPIAEITYTYKGKGLRINHTCDNAWTIVSEKTSEGLSKKYTIKTNDALERAGNYQIKYTSHWGSDAAYEIKFFSKEHERKVTKEKIKKLKVVVSENRDALKRIEAFQAWIPQVKQKGTLLNYWQDNFAYYAEDLTFREQWMQLTKNLNNWLP